jgi:hypothetical protein
VPVSSSAGAAFNSNTLPSYPPTINGLPAPTVDTSAYCDCATTSPAPAISKIVLTVTLDLQANATGDPTINQRFYGALTSSANVLSKNQIGTDINGFYIDETGIHVQGNNIFAVSGTPAITGLITYLGIPYSAIINDYILRLGNINNPTDADYLALDLTNTNAIINFEGFATLNYNLPGGDSHQIGVFTLGYVTPQPITIAFNNGLSGVYKTVVDASTIAYETTPATTGTVTITLEFSS